MSNFSEKHEFALYVHNLSTFSLKVGTHLLFVNQDLFHRMANVLRMDVQQSCIFFDQQQHIKATIIAFSKKNTIEVVVNSIEKNKELQLQITFLLPLLKREAFENAIYSLVELGVNEIQLVITQKTQRKWGGQKEYERLQKIMVSAAEQSKNFAFPTLKDPLLFEDALNQISKESKKIFFDPEGLNIPLVLKQINSSLEEPLILIIGPEGDLMQKEKELLTKMNTVFCCLTPTILRAEQAVVLAAGIFRSFL